MKNTIFIILIINFFTVTTFGAVDYTESDFATEVVDYKGSFGDISYDDPNAVLGKPATQCESVYGSFRVKIIESAINVNLDDEKVITTIYSGEYIVVKFDYKIYDYPGNLHGQDLIVFGNSFFRDKVSDYPTDESNMNEWYLTDSGGVNSEAIIVSVSQDGENWCTFDKYADSLYPTQAYKWDSENACWTDEEMDWLRPVNPNLTEADFASKSVADAIEMYEGSAGGTPFDIQNLDSNDPNYPEIDPQTGYRWIQYVKFEGPPPDYNDGAEVDAVSDVAACGDPRHPAPVGDISGDCRVDYVDFALLVENWLECTFNCDGNTE